MEKTGLKLIIGVCFFVILPVGWLLMGKLEGEKPSVIVTPSPLVGISASKNLSVKISDAKSGLRRIGIRLLNDGKEFVLLKKEFPAGGFFRRDRVHEDAFTLLVQPRTLGMTDGKATLDIIARDYAWRGWLNGNKTHIRQEMIIDTRRPQVEFLSKTHNISQGGSGLVIYRLSESCPGSGVHVGDNFFPGYPLPDMDGIPETSDIFMAFFAVSYKQEPSTDICVRATDPSGNSTKADFPYYIGRRSFRKDKINISDRFLNSKMEEFLFPNPDLREQQGLPESPLEKFLLVNQKLRKANYRKFVEIGKNTDTILHWKGRFKSLPKSKKMAGFADHREYRYKGRTIDHQVHLGIDQASVAHSPVPAANTGKVVFAGELGIYGQTVVVDHGFSLFSTYSHLSSLDVKEGEMVSKGETIGRTGKTGLAGGDHLHFGILLHNTFVNPIEWLDGAWIRDNIKSKIDGLKSKGR